MSSIRAQLQNAEFLTSAPNLKKCPSDDGVEVAFAGRSNAGKSSAINCLTNQKALARTSKTPGRTQLINFFSLEGPRRIVDLPGYGYAKVPDAVKKKWQQSLEIYLRDRQSLFGIFLMMDIRHPMKDFDQMMLDWAKHYQMRVHILLTKADKLKKGPAKSALLTVKKAISDHPELFSVQTFSSLKRTGTDEAWNKLQTWYDEADEILAQIGDTQEASEESQPGEEQPSPESDNQS